MDALSGIETLKFADTEVTLTADGQEALVNTYVDNSQLNSSITGLEDGGYVVVWDSNIQDGSNHGTGILNAYAFST